MLLSHPSTWFLVAALFGGLMTSANRLILPAFVLLHVRGWEARVALWAIGCGQRMGAVAGTHGCARPARSPPQMWAGSVGMCRQLLSVPGIEVPLAQLHTGVELFK